MEASQATNKLERKKSVAHRVPPKNRARFSKEKLNASISKRQGREINTLGVPMSVSEQIVRTVLENVCTSFGIKPMLLEKGALKVLISVYLEQFVEASSEIAHTTIANAKLKTTVADVKLSAHAHARAIGERAPPNQSPVDMQLEACDRRALRRVAECSPNQADLLRNLNIISADEHRAALGKTAAK